MDTVKKDFPDYNDYLESYIAFIDILGFNQKVQSMKDRTDFMEISKLMYAMKEVASKYSADEDILKNFNLTAISDSIIVTIRFDDPVSLYALLAMLHFFQYELLASGFKILCRGYIAKGQVYH